MTLEEFMTCDKNSHLKSGEQWLCWYELAKRSFEVFGENGPDVGSNVITLVNGHCGMGFNLRVFNGSLNEVFFELSVPDERSTSLVEKTKWWKEIVSVKMQDFELPNYVRKRNNRTHVELMAEFIVRG
jgi:hypothetical protein